MSEPVTRQDGGPDWRRIALITGVAVAVFVGMRLLPTGTNLSHMDFRVTGKGALEFCDPANPQFIPVVAVRSPVVLTLRPEGAPAAGREARVALVLRTASGKPIAPEDLLVTHTRRLHLLIVDPTLTDYQHAHPEPGRTRGEWTFAFTPRRGGLYRVFADFTPAATARGLYASADLEVDPAGTPAIAGERQPVSSVIQEGYRFELVLAAPPIRAGRPANLQFSVQRADGGRLSLEPVMGALAHLVAFDEARTGFAHLHPMVAGATAPEQAGPASLRFQITIPRAGRYVIWAQVRLEGRERFAPFWSDVAP